MLKNKLHYLLSSIQAQRSPERFLCPSCGYLASVAVDRKYLVTALRRCERCQLLFRTPTTTPEESVAFYQKKYAQGYTTDLPSEEQLQTYLSRGFLNTERDYSTYIEIVRGATETNKSTKLFEFGCSWGYGSWQFRQQGFEVESFEVSAPRAEFARSMLGVKVHPSLPEISGAFDIFFSSHVLEHVPSVRNAIDFGFRILKSGGLFVAVTPNGSAGHRTKSPNAWHKLWGHAHPNFLDDVFYRFAFAKNPFFLSSNPYEIEKIAQWRTDSRDQKVVDHVDGEELLIIVRKL